MRASSLFPARRGNSPVCSRQFGPATRSRLRSRAAFVRENQHRWSFREGQVLAPEPSRFDKRAWEAWRRTPIFRKDGTTEPWDRYSYKKAWRNALAVVTETYPDEDVAGLWLRDLRKVAKTRMVRACVHPNVINVFLGHRSGAAEEVYFVPELDDLRPAAEALALGQVFGADAGKFAGKSVSAAGAGRSDAGVSGFDLRS